MHWCALNDILFVKSLRQKSLVCDSVNTKWITGLTKTMNFWKEALVRAECELEGEMFSVYFL